MDGSPINRMSMKKKRVPRKIKKAAKKVSWCCDFNCANACYDIYAVVTGRKIKHTQRVLSNLKIAAVQYERAINGERIRLTKFNPAFRYCKCYLLENDNKQWKRRKEYLEKRRKL